LQPSVFTIAVKKIDYATAAAFQDDLLTAVGDGSGRLVIDFAGVETISSIGLRALVVAAKKARAGDGRIAVAALAPVVREVFLISRFDAILPMYDSVAAATAALEAA
jgi:anti-sigma B factor antagonist